MNATQMLRDHSERFFHSDIRNNEQTSSARGANKSAAQANKKSSPVYIKNAFSSIQNFKNYIKYKFSANQWFGTVYMLVVCYQNIQAIKAGKNRQSVSKGGAQDDLSAVRTKKNWSQIIGPYVFNMNNAWTLASARNATPPEGNNMAERMFNALRHPTESQLQATLVTAFPFVLAGLVTNIRYGFFDGEQEENISRKILSVTGATSTFLAYTNMFGKSAKNFKRKNLQEPLPEEPFKKQEAAHFRNSKSNQQSLSPYPIRVLKAAWKNNRRQVFAYIISLIGSFVIFFEGRAKQKSMLDKLEKATTIGSPQWHNMKALLEKTHGTLADEITLTKIHGMRDKKLLESSSLIKKGVTGVIMTLASSFYNMDQLLKGQNQAQQQQITRSR